MRPVHSNALHGSEALFADGPTGTAEAGLGEVEGDGVVFASDAVDPALSPAAAADASGGMSDHVRRVRRPGCDALAFGGEVGGGSDSGIEDELLVGQGAALDGAGRELRRGTPGCDRSTLTKADGENDGEGSEGRLHGRSRVMGGWVSSLRFQVSRHGSERRVIADSLIF